LPGKIPVAKAITIVFLLLYIVRTNWEELYADNVLRQRWDNMPGREGLLYDFAVE